MPDKLKEEMMKREGAKMGPFKGRLLDERDQGAELRPGMRGTFVDQEERDIPTMSQLMSKLQDIGIIPDMGNVSGGVEKAVSVFHPTAMKALGRKTIEDIRTLPSFQGHTPEMVSAWTQLQSKYPRLFGYVSSIEPNMTAEQAKMAGSRLGKYVSGYNEPIGPFSKIVMNPNSRDIYETAAHELTHAAQNVRGKGTFLEKYRQANRIFGYEKNPYEKRATLAGQKFSRTGGGREK